MFVALSAGTIYLGYLTNSVTKAQRIEDVELGVGGGDYNAMLSA